jgi:ATP-dependent DNA helicase RecG
MLPSIIIYANSVEVKNANKPHYFGKLIPGRFEPFPKNPILAKLFTQIGRAEELGTGIRKVFKYIRENTGNDLITFEEDDLFRVQISLGSLFSGPNTNGTLSGILNGTLNGTLNEGQLMVLDFLVQHTGVQAKEIIEQLIIPLGTLNKHLRYLIKNKYIERRGSKKTGGYWVVSNR